MIRPATVDDLPRLIELGRLMHAESRFSSIPFTPNKLETTLRFVLESGCLLVAVREGRIVGGFAGMASEFYFSTERRAGDLALFVEPDARGGITAALLIRAFCAWAKREGIRYVDVGTTTGVRPEQTGALFERLGFQRIGALYRKE